MSQTGYGINIISINIININIIIFQIVQAFRAAPSNNNCFLLDQNILVNVSHLETLRRPTSNGHCTSTAANGAGDAPPRPLRP